MKVQLVRHATLRIEYGGHRFLVDPMFDDPSERGPIENTTNRSRNPMVPLPFSTAQAMEGVEAVLLTHIHSDHWDSKARLLLPKTIPLFCQPADAKLLRAQEFTNVLPVNDNVTWHGVRLHRTEGKHGLGKIGKAMGPVSGFVLDMRGYSRIYVAGDTIWCDEVRLVIDRLKPEYIVVNAGAAQFTEGGPITMGVADVVALATYAHHGRVIAVHMDAINHCVLSRKMLRDELIRRKLEQWVIIPEDGGAVVPGD